MSYRSLCIALLVIAGLGSCADADSVDAPAEPIDDTESSAGYWSKTYSHGASGTFTAIEPRTADTYWLAGEFYDAGSWQPTLTSLRADGEPEWQREYLVNAEERLAAFGADAQGAFVLTQEDPCDGCFSFTYPVRVAKFSAAGKLLWRIGYGDADALGHVALAAWPDGGCIFAYAVSGHTTQEGLWPHDQDIQLVRLDAQGAIRWQAALGGAADDRARALVRTAAGALWLVAETFSDLPSGNLEDVWALRLEPETGAIALQVAYGGEVEDMVGAVAERAGGGLVIAGFSNSFQSYDALQWFVALDATGEIAWQQLLGPGVVVSALHTTGDGFVAAGMLQSDGDSDQGYLAAFADDGAFAWQRSIGRGNGPDRLYAVMPATNGVLAAGFSVDQNPQGNQDPWLVFTTPTGVIDFPGSSPFVTAQLELGPISTAAERRFTNQATYATAIKGTGESVNGRTQAITTRIDDVLR